MGQRILMFESDTAFAQNVRTSFEALGATVEVAGDGQQGLDLATAHRPDLILLSIELPGMNGFLVCKKLKKQDGLADVPLVILSSEATEDVFEQHKKLRTRAEEYLHKPIAFADLLQRVNGYLKLGANGASASAQDLAELPEEEEEEMILVTEDSIPPPPAAALLELDDGGIDALLADEPVAAAAPEPQSAASTGAKPGRSSNPPRQGARSSAPAPARTSMSARPASVSNYPPAGGSAFEAAAAEGLARVQQELNQAQARIAQLETDIGRADKRAKDAEQENQAQKQRAATAERSLSDAGKKSGVSSREFLDLREQLNKKDRELIDLRDQVSSRDKQVIEASDRSLRLERELADLGDKSTELQREIDKSKEIVAALQADKEGAKKRFDDTKARLDRAEGKSREMGEELNGLKLAHAKEIDAHAQLHAEATMAAGAQHAEEIEALQSEHAEASSALRTGHSQELAAIRADHDVALQALREATASKQQAALAELRTELEASAVARLAEQHRQHEAVISSALAAHANELAGTRESLEKKHSDELNELIGKNQLELARVNKALAESDNRAQLLEDQLEETEVAKTDALSRLGRAVTERDQQSEKNEVIEAKIAQLRARHATDEQLLERARKAMAIGIGLLDEQKRAGSDDQAQ